MSYEKNIGQIANAYKAIMKYSERDPWKEKLLITQRDFLLNVANSMDIEPAHLTKTLADNDMAADVYGYIMEVMCSKRYQNEGSDTFTILALEYLEKNSWKLKPFQKAFLQELPNTLFSFWRITKTSTNQVNFESYPFAGYQITLADGRFVEQMKTDDIVLTKLVKVEEEVYPGAIITTLKKELADAIIVESHDNSIEFLNNYKKESEENPGSEILDDEFVKRIYVYNNLDYIIFKHWITDSYKKITNQTSGS
ncbi:hypothetical protein [Thorsellia kenyensis]|uniref:Uncharacterized protein n=1 Tax=Thorsellia kenyensis TaxID=1549888 RepID=A0ABV6CHL4_9GAMM